MARPEVLGSSQQKTTRRVPAKGKGGNKNPGEGSGKGGGSGNGSGGSGSSGNDSLVSNREIRAAVRQKFAPVGQELRRQRRASRQQDDNIDDWYGAYVSAVQAAGGLQAAANVAMGAQFQDRTNQSYDAGLKGALTPQGQQAALARRQSADSFGNLLATQGASAVGLLGQQSVAGAQSRILAHKDEARRRREIAAKFVDLSREKGDYATAYRSEKRQKAFENALLEKEFGLEVAQTAAEAAAAKRAARQDRRDENRDVNQWGYTNKEWRSMSPAERQAIIKDQKSSGSSGDDGGLTPAQKRDRRENSNEAVTEIQDVIGRIKLLESSPVPEYNNPRNPKKKTGEHEATDEEIRLKLVNDGFSMPQIRLAMKIRNGEPLTSADLKLARRLGIRQVPRKWKRGRPTTIERPAQAPGANGQVRPT